jgi:hypothetical protein
VQNLAEKPQLRHGARLVWVCLLLLLVWLAITHRTHVPAYVTVWTGILLLSKRGFIMLLCQALAAIGSQGSTRVALFQGVSDSTTNP